MDYHTLSIFELALLRARDKMQATFPHNIDIVNAITNIAQELESLMREMAVQPTGNIHKVRGSDG